MTDSTGTSAAAGVVVDDGVESRIDTLLGSMSTAEKVGQVNQRLFGWECVERARGGFRVTPTFTDELDRWQGMGATYGLFRADAWSGRSWDGGIRPEERAEVAALVQETVRAASPHGIGTLVVEEAPHGHQALGGTLLPTNLSVAAGWDVELFEEAAAAVAAGLAASGVHVALVSALDMLRDPRWGRSEECFGEDPLLTAALTRALVTGMQGPDRSRVGAGGVAVVLKHLAAQGEAVGGRNGHSAVIGRHDLEQIHLPPVRAGIEVGALGFMAAYNDIDGIPCCASEDLLTRYLRDEHGFDGIVMADGFAVDRLETTTGSLDGAARAAILAGVDLSLWDTSFARLDGLAVTDEGVAAALDRACRRVLRLKAMFGLLAPLQSAATRPQAITTRPVVTLAAADARADAASRRLADQALVLLQNHGAALPLDAACLRRVVVAGPSADDVTAMLGDYVPPLPGAADTGPAGQHRSISAALVDALPGARVDVCTGVPSAEALDGADVVVLVVGGTSHRSYADDFADNGAIRSAPTHATCGEGVDRADVSLPHGQDALVAAVRAAASCPVVTVVVAGRPHVLTTVASSSDAVLWAGYPGPHGGTAVADVLLGLREPVGRLPMTLPRHASALPVRYNDRQASAGVYQDAPSPVLFPFGHGLRYREVEVHDLSVDVSDREVRVGVRVTNPADDEAVVIVPVVAHRRGGRLSPRLSELVAFERVCVPARSTSDVVRMLSPETCFADPDDPSSTTVLGVLDLRQTVRPAGPQPKPSDP